MARNCAGSVKELYKGRVFLSFVVVERLVGEGLGV